VPRHAIDKPARAADLAACLGALDRLVSRDVVSDECASQRNLLRVLEQCNGNKSAAARLLRRSRGWVERRLAGEKPR
jgi:ActR/RegA family two-component response regulator